MTTLPSSSDDGDRPLFADSVAPDQPVGAPVVRRRSVLPPVQAPASAPPPPAFSTGPAVPAAPTAAKAPAGVLIGRINSQVTEVRKPYQFLGFAVLLAVVVAAVGAVCLYAAGGALIGLLCAAIVLIAMVFLFGRLMGGWSALFVMIARGLIWLVSSVVALGVRGAGAAARGVSQTRGASRDLIVRRFQVQLVTGEYITCLLDGRLADGELQRDDHVGIVGRAHADHYIVQSVDVFSGPGGSVVRRVRATLPLDFRILRWLDRGAFVLAALVVAALVVVIVQPVRQ